MSTERKTYDVEELAVELSRLWAMEDRLKTSISETEGERGEATDRYRDAILTSRLEHLRYIHDGLNQHQRASTGKARCSESPVV